MRFLPREKRVLIKTVGWKQIGAEWSYSFDDLLDKPLTGLRAKLERLGVGPVDLFIDCRPLRSKDCDHLLGHTGHNAMIIDAINKSSKLKKMMNLVKRYYENFKANEGEEEFTVVAVCTSGTHRSVAVACICEKVFLDDGYFPIVEHLNENVWAKRQLCRTCQYCRPGNWYTAEALKTSLQLWKSV